MTAVVGKLLAWYEQNQRALPWRGTNDPYAIWVAEVMLQQTRVETVKPYYRRWMEVFPTVDDLAAAEQGEVLILWEGLGYYQRARNLHKAAQQVVEEFDGELPREQEALRQLAGIGPYTAAAIAAIAFGAEAVALDGNLRRVLARLDGIQLDVRSPAGERALRAQAEAILPADRAAEFNQALMDLGSMVCTPKSPACSRCPLQDDCQAYAAGLQNELPRQAARRQRPHVLRAIAVIEQGSTVLIGRRPQDQLLGGLWEFPGYRVQSARDLPGQLAAAMERGLGIRCRPLEAMESIDHGYTHYRVTAYPFRCRLQEGSPDSMDHTELRWVSRRELPDHPMGRIDRTIADSLLE